jgi:putative SOS response-associated peptidase YedK
VVDFLGARDHQIRIGSQEWVMCGRYRLSRRKQLIAEYFDTDNEVDWEPRYNIAPSQAVDIIRQDPSKPERHFSLARWGLIPSWACDASIGLKTINARSDGESGRR